MHELFKQLPEVFGPFKTSIRVPEYTNVPATGRLLSLVDSREFQRLRMIRQLGFVDAVFPGATHSRFEHSVGVYNRARQVVKQLCESEGLLDAAEPEQITMLLVGCLVHDIGHYFCAHVIEELGKIKELRDTFGQFDHLETGYRLLTHRNSELGAAIEKHFDLSRRDVAEYIYRKNNGGGIAAELYGLLDGPIDVDKMDYLERDSIHSGVPYGRNFDAGRLMNNFTVARVNNREKILLKEKGKAGAEVFIFSRYVMFTEVYWHHTSRCLSAMFRRAFLDLARRGVSVEELMGEKVYYKRGNRYFNDQESFRYIVGLAQSGGRATRVARQLLEAISSGRKGLYKRLLMLKPMSEANGRVYESKIISQRISQSYRAGLETWMSLLERVVRKISKKCGIVGLREHHILIDTPMKGDKGTTYPLWFPGERLVRDITEVSPVAGALDKSFNEAAQQVRLYVHPDFAGKISKDHALSALLECLE